MSFYRYIATAPGGKPAKVLIEAENEKEALSKLRSRQLNRNAAEILRAYGCQRSVQRFILAVHRLNRRAGNDRSGRRQSAC